MSGIPIAVVDYGTGNVRSIAGGLERAGAAPFLTREPSSILGAAGLVLPGVGAFRSGMDRLRESGLVECILRFADSGKPLLGICLGMQLLMEEGEEFGPSKGLGLFRGRVERLPVREKLPHVGWNGIEPPCAGRWSSTIFHGVAEGADVYFVHSYAAVPENPEEIACLTGYGGRPFVSAIRRGNLAGCQFHPEKSGAAGLGILSAYVKSCS